MRDLDRLKAFVGVAFAALLLSCQSVDPPFDDGKRWGDAERIEDGPADAERPEVAIDATGTAIAVWDQTDRETFGVNNSDDIWSNELGAPLDGEWGSVVRLDDPEENEPCDSIGAKIGVGGDGSALIVFVQQEETTIEGECSDCFTVWAIHREPGASWGNPMRIQPYDPSDCEPAGAVAAARPQVAVDSRGVAVVVWQQTEGSDENLNIWSNRFTPGEDWAGASPVEDDSNILVAPQVGMDASGNAMAIWERIDGSDLSSIFSKRQTPDGAWTGFQNVEFDDRGNAFEPQIAVDALGNAIAVWQQDATGEQRFDIWSNRYDVATGEWESAVGIGPQHAGDASKPQVAMDEDGNAIAVWVQSGGARAGIWSNRYLTGGRWGTATRISPSGLGPARAPQVASDPEGNAVAVWVQFDDFRGEDAIWANRYRPGQGWGGSDSIDALEDGRALGPQVAVDEEGNAVAVWTRRDRSGPHTWSNRLVRRSE